MSARRVWIATCDICETTKEFDGSLEVDELGHQLQKVGWRLPIYGGTFCGPCASAVEALSNRKRRGNLV